MDQDSIIKLIAILILLFLSSFFSSAETAFSAANKVRIETLADDGNKKAKRALRIIDNFKRMLSTVLIGNNIVNIAASAIVTLLAQDLFGQWAVSLGAGILTIVLLLFGEIVPKTWAKINANKLVLIYAPIIDFVCLLLTPIRLVIDYMAMGIMFICRIDPDKKEITITEDELLSYVDAGHDEGVIEPEEKEIIYNLFDFTDSLVKDVMIPRPDIVEVDVDASYDDVKNVFRDNMYTRIPVYEETPEKIVGIINIKDFLFVEDPDFFDVRNIMREVYFTYEFKKTQELLNEMREKSAPMTIVLNEYGAAEGLVTLEDLLEEIVGDIKDEYDEDERDTIKEIGEREYLIEGSMKLDDINDRLGTKLESENYDSIGGMVIDHLDDRLPEEGEEVTLSDGTLLKVVQFTDNRIVNVKMVLPEISEEASGEKSEDESDGKESTEETSSRDNQKGEK